MNALLLGSSLAALAVLVPTVLLSSEAAPLELQGQKQVQKQAEAKSVEWHTDLAAAQAEARRTKRPLLAIFR